MNIIFNSFTTELGADFVTLYDGRSDAYECIANLSGTLQTPFSYYSTGEFMYIRFVTDSSFPSGGFTANFISIDDPGKFELKSRLRLAIIMFSGVHKVVLNGACIWLYSKVKTLVIIVSVNPVYKYIVSLSNLCCSSTIALSLHMVNPSS